MKELTIEYFSKLVVEHFEKEFDLEDVRQELNDLWEKYQGIKGYETPHLNLKMYEISHLLQEEDELFELIMDDLYQDYEDKFGSMGEIREERIGRTSTFYYVPFNAGDVFWRDNGVIEYDNVHELVEDSNHYITEGALIEFLKKGAEGDYESLYNYAITFMEGPEVAKGVIEGILAGTENDLSNTITDLDYEIDKIVGAKNDTEDMVKYIEERKTKEFAESIVNSYKDN